MAKMKINVLSNPIVACTGNVPAGGNAGVYEVSLNVGSAIGYTGIRYDAVGVPDRFQIYYNNTLVADSKFVGDSIALPSSPTGGIILGTYNMANYAYNGTTFVATGTTTSVTINSTDIANNTTEPTDGNGVLLFNKTAASPNIIRIVATGSPNDSTSWNLRGICPIPESSFIEGTEKFIYKFFTEPNKALQTRSAKFVLNNAGTRFYTDKLGGTLFGNYGYTLSAQYINDGINWWRIDQNGNILETGTL